MGEQAQFDLAVVAADEDVAGLGDEGLADGGAFLGADRDVLQVGIGAGEAASAGDGLGEAGVDAAGLGVDLLDEGLGVGAAELVELPPVDDAGGQVVALVGEGLQDVDVGGPGAGGGQALAAGKLHLVEQDLAERLGAAEVEGPAGHGVDLGFHDGHAAGEVGGHAAQLGFVHLDAGLFHAEQDGHEPPLHLFVEGQAFGFAQAGAAGRARGAGRRRRVRPRRRRRARAAPGRWVGGPGRFR